MLRILLASTLLLTACASRKLSQPADLVSASTQVNLEISSEIIHEYTDPYNVVMQINLESKDGQWIRVDSAELDLTNTDGIVQNIIIGKDLNAWLQAKAEEKMIREQNADITSLGLRRSKPKASILRCERPCAFRSDLMLAAILMRSLSYFKSNDPTPEVYIYGAIVPVVYLYRLLVEV